MKTSAKITAALFAFMLTLPVLVGCGGGFSQGELTTAAVTSRESAPTRTPIGSWFCPDELCGLILLESEKEGEGEGEIERGKCEFYTMTSPTSKRESTEGEYTIEDSKLTIILPSGESEYEFIFNSGKMLILTDRDGKTLTFTASSD